MNNGFNNFNNMNGLGGNMMLNNGMFGGGNNGELKVLLVLTYVTTNKPIFIFTGPSLSADFKYYPRSKKYVFAINEQQTCISACASI